MANQPGDSIRKKLDDLKTELKFQSDEMWPKPATDDINYDDYISDEERSMTPMVYNLTVSDINENVQDIYDKADYVDLNVVVKPLDNELHDDHQEIMENHLKERDWHTISFISTKNPQSAHDILDKQLVIPRWSPYKELDVKDKEKLGPTDPDQRDMELYKLHRAYEGHQGYLDYRDELASSYRDTNDDFDNGTPSSRRPVGGNCHRTRNGNKWKGENVTVQFR